MPPKEFECKQCGKCCRNLLDAYVTSVDEDDINIWERKGRTDILERIVIIPLGEDCAIYDVWFDPDTGEEFDQCPWLEKIPGTERYLCLIHDVKPRHCREYPKSRQHAKDTGCPGLRYNN